jgi:tetraacyldisaccharide 4'-kinase
MIYETITDVRNLLYDKGVLKSESFDIPVISIGNLSVGGTGKTPHTEFFIRILEEKFKVAVLSRGYGRKTSGFYLLDDKSHSEKVGDEPYLIFRKFPNVVVAVDEDRVHGIKKLLKLYPDIQVILLDDAFQHRSVVPGLSVLLTEYNNLYTEDFVMPAGSLRESEEGSERADMIIVTKCPDEDMLPLEYVKERLNKPEQPVFFTKYKYDNIVPVFYEVFTEKPTLLQYFMGEEAITLFVGIAHPAPMLTYLHKFTDNVRLLEFPDHHDFTKQDYETLQKNFDKQENEHKYIFVTEKDAARIVNDENFPDVLKPYLYALPIKVKLLKNHSKFINKIRVYVEKKLQGQEYNVGPKKRLTKKEMQQMELDKKEQTRLAEKATKEAGRRPRVRIARKKED